MTHLHPCDLPDCTLPGEPDAAALKADRDHLLTVLENTTSGLRMALDGGEGHAERWFAARELLRQAKAALAEREGAAA